MAHDEQDDRDSTFGGFDNDDEISTTSLTSSILNYQYENGRRYHGGFREGQYFMPNDERAQEVRNRPYREQA